MSIALLRIGDGRTEVHERCWQSARENLPLRLFSAHVVVDDAAHELGFAGAIQKGWADVLDTGADYCFWLEMDFLFERVVPLRTMQAVLDYNPHLVQMALLRGPENDAEHEAGGVIQQNPGNYFPVRDWIVNGDEQTWIEHRNFFTTNPNLCPTWIMGSGWPQEPESEGKFGLNLFASDPSLRSAFWGQGETWIEHVGQRAGVGY